MPGLRRLLHFVRPYRFHFVIAALAALVAAVLEGFVLALLIPVTRLMFGGAASDVTVSTIERAMSGLIGFFFGDGPVTVGIVVTLVLATIVIKNAASYLAGYMTAFLQEGVTRDIRSRLFEHVLAMDLAYLQRTRGGQLSTRMTADVEDVHLLINTGLQSLVSNGILVVVYLTMLFALSWELALLILLLAPLIALGTKPLFSRMRVALVRAAERRGDMMSVFQETITGARVVRVYSAQHDERTRFHAALDEQYDAKLRGNALALLTHPISEIFAGGMFAVLLLLGMGWVSAGSMSLSPEAFITFLAVTLRMLPAVKRLAHFPAVAENSLAGANRVFQTLDSVSADQVDDDEQEFAGLRERIEFDSVGFTYESGPPALEDLSFIVNKGEVVALVGPSGAGKSTALDLLVRFFDPTQGAIRLDGILTTALSRSSLRRAMGVVSQEGIVFNQTVHANIAYGLGDSVSRDAVIEAAQLARAHDFIQRLSDGYDTQLGERGTLLSGGERQRIAIARALVRDPEILIMDEATSALDSESELILREAMAAVLRDRTVLIVAHRLSTVARADRIVVMDAGRVVAVGTHPELLDQNDLYRRLYDAAEVRT